MQIGITFFLLGSSMLYGLHGEWLLAVRSNVVGPDFIEPYPQNPANDSIGMPFVEQDTNLKSHNQATIYLVMNVPRHKVVRHTHAM
jgi:hypothetical protein